MRSKGIIRFRIMKDLSVLWHGYQFLFNAIKTWENLLGKVAQSNLPFCRRDLPFLKPWGE